MCVKERGRGREKREGKKINMFRKGERMTM